MTKKTITLLAFMAAALCGVAQELFSLQDFVSEYTFSPAHIDGLKPMNDGAHYSYYSVDDQAIVAGSYANSDSARVLLKLSGLGIGRFYDYALNANEDKVLIATNAQYIYRRSLAANYHVWSKAAAELLPIDTLLKQEQPTFSPDGNKLAYIISNNLYIRDLDMDSSYAITLDGIPNVIINGKPDWVYEEEFEFAQAYQWSPTGRYLAYMKFDESRVKEYTLQYYVGNYPYQYKWKYPKAGEANSVVSVHVYDLETGQTIPVDLGPEKDQYIPRIKWTQQDDKLCVYRLNRLQNKLELLLADAKGGSSSVIYTDTNTCYIDEKYIDFLEFTADGQHFVMASERDGFNHLYLYKTSGELVNQITEGEWEVTHFFGVDKESKFLYYESAEESPLQRQAYKIKLTGKGKKQLTPNSGTNECTFSKDFSYFINTHSSAVQPPKVTVHGPKGKPLQVLQDNQWLQDTLKHQTYNNKEFFQFTTSDSITLNGYMIKPLDFDPEIRYPVFMIQYSGPNHQMVTDQWKLDWTQVLAQDGYLVVCVDGRGTGGRGEAFKKAHYLNLGKYETQDQIEAAKYLKSLSYVDGSRIGIYGWSYGGFVSLLCMTKGADVFKTGIAIAPVTNWAYYDNIYTERFMRKPDDNVVGYNANSPINFANKLEGHLLIVHGMADDNVHLQNSAEMIDKLVKADKDFDMVFYPNNNHSMSVSGYYPHLFKKIRQYILENL